MYQVTTSKTSYATPSPQSIILPTTASAVPSCPTAETRSDRPRTSSTSSATTIKIGMQGCSISTPTMTAILSSGNGTWQSTTKCHFLLSHKAAGEIDVSDRQLLDNHVDLLQAAMPYWCWCMQGRWSIGMVESKEAEVIKAQVRDLLYNSGKR